MVAAVLQIYLTDNLLFCDPSVMSMTEKSSEVSRSYSHEEIRDELDRLNRQLEDMKETILNTSGKN